MAIGNTAMTNARVVGARQTTYEKHPKASALDLSVEVIGRLIEEVGLSPSEIDGLAVSSFQLAPDNVVTVAEHLGLQLRWAFQGAHGGASGVVSLMQAAEAITSGRASAVVCAAADSFNVSSHMAMLDSFNTGMRDYLAPYCFGGTNGIFALVEREHRSRYGTTREQLGKLAVTQRRHAQRNPNALLQADMSLDNYLNARLIAEPVRLYDCVMPCGGADAVMVVSKEIAARLRCDSIRILAGEQMHNYAPCEALSLTTGAAAFAERLFKSAGVRHEDLNFIQLYDDYPIMELIQLEDLGFAPKGSGGRFVEEHDFSLDGDLPLNTGGGQLSCGQAGASGGMIGLFEAVIQLTHKAGARQVSGAQLGLVSGFGMVGYGRGLSSAAVVLSSVEARS